MDTEQEKTELSTISRVARIVVGIILIGITMNTTGPLGMLVLLPLLAVYPILTGIIGEDPLDVLLASWKGGFGGNTYQPSTRVALIAIGGAAIASVLAGAESVGTNAFLALASVYPIMAGLFGEDLVSIALGLNRKQTQERAEQSIRLVHSTDIRESIGNDGQKSTPARQHKFGHGVGPKAA